MRQETQICVQRECSGEQVKAERAHQVLHRGGRSRVSEKARPTAAVEATQLNSDAKVMSPSSFIYSLISHFISIDWHPLFVGSREKHCVYRVGKTDNVPFIDSTVSLEEGALESLLGVKCENKENQYLIDPFNKYKIHNMEPSFNSGFWEKCTRK